jgi:ketosteroid isomerase-like protein
MSLHVKTALLIAALLPWHAGSQHLTGPVGTSAERENLAASVAWDVAFNSENLSALMTLYSEGVVSMPPGFPALIGKSAVEADFAFLFDNFDFTHQTTVMQLEIQGSLAVERGEYTMLVVPADGSPAFTETGKHIVVRRLVNGSWVHVMETWNLH